MDVIRGRMIVEYRDGELAVDEPVKDFHGAALKGCDECADFLGRSARHLGRQRRLHERLDQCDRPDRAGPPGLPGRPVQARRARAWTTPLRSCGWTPSTRRSPTGRLQRKLDPDAPLFIDFEEHVRAYDGTDRRPVFIRH